MNKNPTIIINGISGLVAQILPLLVIIGAIHPTPEVLAAWISISGIVLTFISTTIIRSQVVPTETANQQIREGIKSPQGTTVEQVVKKVEEQNA